MFLIRITKEDAIKEITRLIQKPNMLSPEEIRRSIEPFFERFGIEFTIVDKYSGQPNEYPDFNKAPTQLKSCSNCGTPCAGAPTDNLDPCLSWSLRPLTPPTTLVILKD